MLKKLTTAFLLALAGLVASSQAAMASAPTFIDADKPLADMQVSVGDWVYFVSEQSPPPDKKFAISGKAISQLPANAAPLIVRGTVIAGFEAKALGAGDIEVTTAANKPGDKPQVVKIKVTVVKPTPPPPAKPAPSGHGGPMFLDVGKLPADLEVKVGETVYFVRRRLPSQVQAPPSVKTIVVSGTALQQLPAGSGPLIISGSIQGGFQAKAAGSGTVEITMDASTPAGKPLVFKIPVKVVP